MAHEPQTLQEAIIYFADPRNCRDYVVARRWPDGVTCPICGSQAVRFSAKHNRWQCGSHHPRRQFTLKTGTVFEDSPLGMDKWACAMWMLANCKNGVSSYEIHRDIGVTQKTAWFMLHRIRLAMQSGSTVKIGGPGTEVEADETFIGGKARNMHRSKRIRLARYGEGRKYGKTIVMGLLERQGHVRTKVIPHTGKPILHGMVREHVQSGANLYTDELASYLGLEPDYEHKIINHMEKYVDGRVHTNGMENFWSLLKRGIGGTYISVEPFHLFRYLDEQAFRYNNRKDFTDSDRFSLAVSQIMGKRLTFAEVTGKVGETRAN